MLLGYAAIYVLFWPLLPGINDEAGFINQALLWTRGAELRPLLPQTPADDLLLLDGDVVSWRNPGRSLLLLPFLPLGDVRWLYVSSLLLHLGTAVAAAALLRRAGASPLWAALVLFHPTLALYSRTLMADGPAGLALLLALLALTARRRPGFLAGLATGFGALLRYQVGLALVFVAAAVLTCPWIRDRRRQAAECLLGGAVIAVPLFLYNWTTYGAPLGFSGQGGFGLRYVPGNAAIYVGSLLLFWPLLPLALKLAPRGWRRPVRIIVIPFLAVLLLYSWHDVGSTPLETLVVSLRLLQPLLPIWIFAYALMLETRLGPLVRRRVPAAVRGVAMAGAGLCLLGGQAALFARHQAHLRGLAATRAEVTARIPEGATVIANRQVRKLFAVLDPDQPRYRWIEYERDNRVLDPAPHLGGEAPVYFAILPKRPGFEFPEVLAELIRRHGLERIPNGRDGLLLYRSPGGAAGAGETEP